MKKKVKIHYPPFIQINLWLPKLLIKQFFCKHEWKYDPFMLTTHCTKCSKLIGYYDDTMDKLVKEEFKDGGW